jgi:hypothetical protein
MPWFRRPTVTGVEARGGFLDRPVLAVLLISLVLVVVGFAGAFVGVW